MIVQIPNGCANFKPLCLEWAVARTHNIRLKEIKKRRALRGKQRVEHLMNSVGKRTVVVLNPSFFTSLIPSSLCETLYTIIQHTEMKSKKHFCILLFVCIWHQSFSQWTTLSTNTNQFLFGEYFLNKDTGFVFGDAVILKTIDGGTSWNTPFTSLASQFTSMTFANDSIGFLVGDGGAILKTTDGGNNWFSQFAQPELFYSTDFTDSLNGIIVGDEASIRITSNGGQTWTSITAPYLFGDSSFHYELRTVQFINDSVAYAAGGPYYGSTGILLKTSNKGNSWNIVFQSHDFPVFLQIEFLNDSLGFASGSCHNNNPFCYRSRILKTDDGGLNWTEIYSDWADELRSIDVVGNSIYSVGYQLGNTPVVYSSDLGLNWSYQSTPNITYPYQVFFTDSLTGYIVGDNGVVLKTNNGGVGFNELQSFRNDIKIHPNPNNGLFSVNFSQQKDKFRALEIRDINGRCIFSRGLLQGSTFENISLTDIVAGVYLLRIFSNTHAVSKILVIQP